MADKKPSPAAAAEAPPLPPQPLLPVPKSKLPARALLASAAQLIPGLAAPSPEARGARAAAASARSAIERHITQGRALLAQLKPALAAHDASAEAQAEWQREGVDAGVVHAFADHLESALQQFTKKAQ